MHNFK